MGSPPLDLESLFSDLRFLRNPLNLLEKRGVFVNRGSPTGATAERPGPGVGLLETPQERTQVGSLVHAPHLAAAATSRKAQQGVSATAEKDGQQLRFGEWEVGEWRDDVGVGLGVGLVEQAEHWHA